MIKYGVFAVLGAFAALVAIILIRTLTYGASGTAPLRDLPEPPSFDKAEAAQHVSEAIQFLTITVNNGDPREGQEGPWLALHDWLEDTYPAFHAAAQKEMVPGGYTLLYTWAGSEPDRDPLLLMAHQDVVPVNLGTTADWDAGPFSGKIQDGYIYGRGTIDNKSGLVAIMEAAEALAKSGFQPKRTLLLMFGHDEEVSGSGAEAGVALLKSRGVSPIMALDEGLLAIETNAMTGGPIALIGIAEKGYLTLQLTARAEGGHSSTPPQNSATIRLAKALVALDDNQMPVNLSEPPVAELFTSLGQDMSFLMRMAFANQWLFGSFIEQEMAKDPSTNAMIRTTTAPTMLTGSAKENVLAQRASAIVNFRIHPNDTEGDVLAHIQRQTAHIDGLTISSGQDGIAGMSASPVSPTNSAAYRVLASVAHEMTDGAPVAPGLVLGATDARFASAITDRVYRFLPALMANADLTGFHGTNERITIENIERMVRAYGQIILAMDALEEPE